MSRVYKILIISFLSIVPSFSAHASINTADLVAKLNVHRAEVHIGKVSVSSELTAAAYAKARDMFAHGYFAHISPFGITPWYWMTQSGYKYSYAGENLAVDFTEASDVDVGWMHSPKHKENIVNKNYTEVGIAAVEGVLNGKATTIVVEMFGSPRLEKGSPAAEKSQSQIDTQHKNIDVGLYSLLTKLLGVQTKIVG